MPATQDLPTPKVASHVFMDLDLCTVALSCWTMFGPLSSSEGKTVMLQHTEGSNRTSCFQLCGTKLDLHTGVMLR